MPLKSTPLGPFPGGVDNRAREEALAQGFCREAVNLDIDIPGGFRRRSGYVSIYPGVVSSLFAHRDALYFVEDQSLKRLVAGEVATLRAGLGDSAGFVDIGDLLFVGTPTFGGRITGAACTPWAATVTRQPDVYPATDGGLLPGTYKVALTWTDTHGVESGTTNAAEVVVADGGGIRVDNFPAPPPETAYLSLYVSEPNAEVLYLHGDYPAATTEAQVAVSDPGPPLNTQFLTPQPPSDIIATRYGYLYTAVDNVLYMSEPFRPGFVKDGYFMFEDPIRLIAPVSNGVFVATEGRHYFLTIDEAMNVQRNEILPYGAGKCRPCAVGNTNAMAWMSHRGVVVGNQDGSAVNLTEDHIQPATYSSGAMLFRDLADFRQLISSNFS